MRANKLEQDDVILPVEIPAFDPTKSWPWFNDFEASLQADVCGPIEYFITDLAGQPQDMVSLVNGDVLLFQPQLYHDVGTYTLMLNARMVNYGYQVTNFEYFDVEVLPCMPVIDTSAV